MPYYVQLGQLEDCRTPNLSVLFITNRASPMNLDDLDLFHKLDTQGMCTHIDQLPDQLEAAWAMGHDLPLPASFKSVERIVICGLGTSGVAADVMAALAAYSTS